MERSGGAASAAKWGAAALAVLLGCHSDAGSAGGSGKRTSAEGGSAPGSPGSGSGEAAASAPASAKPAPSSAPSVSPAARKTYLTHYKAGDKLARTKRWGEAVVEFEKALAAVPMDARALAGLGWAAFNAGDHEKARRANADALRAEGDPKRKAAILYNQGRVLEAAGDAPGAVHLYFVSLALRPNEVVRKRLERLATTPGAPGAAAAAGALSDFPHCTEPVARAVLCDCLKRSPSLALEAEEEDWERTCDLEARSHRLAVARVGWSTSEASYLLVSEEAGGVAVVAVLADYVYDPGMFGILEDFTVEKIEERALGPARVLWIESEHRRHDTDEGIAEEESTTRRYLTLCVRGPGADVRTRCPLHTLLRLEYVRDRFHLATDEDVAAAGDLATPGLPIHKAVTFAVELSPEGTATVKLVKGASWSEEKTMLGPHRLW